ncbi:MAG: hypothetical protein LBH29_04505 [Elusimicrobiota bacterium]|jgi:hypothetical protein|nr:hypothetical protein [Elusimicrobiota bacterium]
MTKEDILKTAGGIGANISEGATFGLGDILYGNIAASIEKARDNFGKAPKLVKDKLNNFYLSGEDGNIRHISKEQAKEYQRQAGATFGALADMYRGEFNDFKGQYNKEHPVIGALSEVGGSIAPALLMPPISAAGKINALQKALRGAVTGAKWSAAHSLGNTLTEGEDLTGREILERLGIDAASGAILSGLGAPISAISNKIISKIEPKRVFIEPWLKDAAFLAGRMKETTRNGEKITPPKVISDFYADKFQGKSRQTKAGNIHHTRIGKEEIRKKSSYDLIPQLDEILDKIRKVSGYKVSDRHANINKFAGFTYAETPIEYERIKQIAFTTIGIDNQGRQNFYNTRTKPYGTVKNNIYNNSDMLARRLLGSLYPVMKYIWEKENRDY